jgi:enediyne polyketide synthase
MAAIALVGMACRYPDARSPRELWENVLAGRQAFRRLPPERLRLEDYYAPDGRDPDRTSTTEAALIEGYEFDRVRYRVSGASFRSADLAHWLALDVAAEALADAGFPEGDGLPRETTGVLLGNTLTGEFSRAEVLRLRWPYVRRVTEASLTAEGWAPPKRAAFLARLEEFYKAPFCPVGEETLAGSLSNTIAGRICNHFDLHGGGYTVDGACASSLLAVIQACAALTAGDLDVALAGGVDLSLDPFELVGFARAGALAREAMRVYDRRSAGFWPGEGCGVVVLMRADEAAGQRRRIYAQIRGWGVSSDGSGGLTRPEVEGHLLALRRAYRRAGFGIGSVAYFEGHGTGTAVGDAAELAALARARREATPEARPAVLGSVKANIGHTKAAAGAAGLIKTALALHAQILPPTTGCDQPHALLMEEAAPLRVSAQGECWPCQRPLRAGVSAMGFGGINTHVVLEGVALERRQDCGPREQMLLSSAQDAELFLLAASSADALRRQVEQLGTFADRLARAELADVAAVLARDAGGGPWRAAVVASTPAELAAALATLATWLAEGTAVRLDPRSGAFLGAADAPPRIGFLFPGQGSPVYLDGGAWGRRFAVVRELYARASVPGRGDARATAVAQPAVVTAALAGLRLLTAFGVGATAAIGHSLGELVALHWAGALEEEAVLRIAAARGQAMEALTGPRGDMASIGASPAVVEALLQGTSVVVAGLNSLRQTVVSGEAAAVAAVVTRARADGLPVFPLLVSRAFHSPLVAPAATGLARQLRAETFRPLRRRVASTVTGTWLSPEDDLRALLCRQVTAPVRFRDALAQATDEIDLWIEVGPGHVLCGLACESAGKPALALDAGGPSLKELWHAVGAAFALGSPIVPEALFAGRFTRSFDLAWRPRFFANPCEQAPSGDGVSLGGMLSRPGQPGDITHDAVGPRKHGTPPDPPDPPDVPDLRTLIRQLVAERAELPVSAVRDDDRLLGQLHLNSITVGQLVAEASRRVGLPPPVAPTDYADATVSQVACALEELARTREATPAAAEERFPPGVDSWIRGFTVALVERPLARRPASAGEGTWRVLAPPGHPLAVPLTEALPGGRGGVIVCLPRDADERHLGLLLDGAHAVLEARTPSRFVLVQHGTGGAAFARTLHLEGPEVTTCVVDMPLDHPRAAEWVRAEALAAVGYTEAHYDAAGRRREPVLRPLPDGLAEAALPLGPADVLLVTGGGKGIAAECARALARESGARLVLVGRSRPETDAELAANLARLAAAGVRFRYLAADITDAEAVRTAVRAAEAELGPVTALLHGAGANVPQLLPALDEAAVRNTLAPKVGGFRNVLAAVRPERLRLVVTFGSLIARTGLRGEADYALANDWLTGLTERFQAEHPACRCLAVEWSVWSGVGMAQRLGRVDALMRQGIVPLPPDAGIAWLRDLLCRRLPAVAVVVTGRFGEPPTLQVERAALPFLRFLELPRVHYPGVELVADAELSVNADPYVTEHQFGGERLLPAVLGLEAMAQAAMALTGSAEPPTFEDVAFRRPVVVPGEGSVAVRLAALVRQPGLVEVVLRSAQTAFQADHFRALCRFGAAGTAETESEGGEDTALVSLDPAADLYGDLLFQTGRFRRLRGYRGLRAKACAAEITPTEPTTWFGRYLPPTLVLADPAARDAAVHAIQACIPHATILPVGVDRLIPATAPPFGPLLVQARERLRDGDVFVYDVQVTDGEGRVWERWEGLRLRRLGARAPRAWVAPLLGPYLARRLAELIPGAVVDLLVERQPDGEPRPDSTAALRRLLGTPVPIHRRPDGKPEAANGAVAVSAAHAGALLVVAAGPGPLGLDVEPVTERPTAVWQDLLGPDGAALANLVAREAGEDEAAAATRVWAAAEGLKKAGAGVRPPLVLATSTADGWVVLAAGAWRVATLVTAVRGAPGRLALAVPARSDHAGV